MAFENRNFVPVMLDKVEEFKRNADTNNKGCLICPGPHQDRAGYGRFRLRIGAGHRLDTSLHRVTFFVYTPDKNSLMPNEHISHRCHNRACFNYFHLSLETSQVNNARRKCVRDHNCTGHGDYLPCLL